MRIVLYSVFALLLAAIPAQAEEPEYPLENQDVMTEVNGSPARLLACFEEVMMPAKVLVEPILVSPERRAYVKRRDGSIELVEYPAHYREKRTVLVPAYVELRQVPCKKKKSFFGLF